MTSYLLIALAVAGALLVGSGVVIKDAWEDNAQLEQRLIDQRRETEQANALITDLKVQNALHNQELSQLETARAQERIDHAKQIQKIRQQLESSTRAALEEPARFGRIATYNLRRLMRSVCRSGGGTADDCRIEIPEPVAAAAGAAAESDDSGAADRAAEDR